ncbi:MAG: RHS repeat-associated core domain-containing protein [Gemmatimonadetes bacterium]|nr:RHS repeat-associated core domain-containing protein [Gemmatimonadota bacterium]
MAVHGGSVSAGARGLLTLSWHGSLLQEKREAGGLIYQRNRLYDPKSGRFTQEDPIGLAGGLNLYGYANGDPVNFSDPFGTCKVQVGYTRVRSLGRHAFITVTSPDNTATVYRGGPTTDTWSERASNSSKTSSGRAADAGGADSKAADNSSFGRIRAESYSAWGARDYENPSAVSYDSPVVDNQEPCDDINASLEGTAAAINARRIGYHTFSANSNSVVNTMLLRSGLPYRSLNRRAVAGNVNLLP